MLTGEMTRTMDAVVRIYLRWFFVLTFHPPLDAACAQLTLSSYCANSINRPNAMINGSWGILTLGYIGKEFYHFGACSGDVAPE